MKSFRITAITLLLPALAACATPGLQDAQPEKYANFDCDQLSELAESYRPGHEAQLFSNTEVSDFELRNESGQSRRLGETSSGARPYEIAQARDRRSIAVARRQKGC